MKLRDLTLLEKTSFFEDFISTVGLNSKIVDGGIFIKTNCILINIYGYYTESWIYISLYNFENKSICFNTLPIEYDLKIDLKKIYDYYEKNHVILVAPYSPPGTILAEATFFARVDILKFYINKLISCDLSGYEKYFEKASQEVREHFDNIILTFPK